MLFSDKSDRCDKISRSLRWRPFVARIGREQGSKLFKCKLVLIFRLAKASSRLVGRKSLNKHTTNAVSSLFYRREGY